MQRRARPALTASCEPMWCVWSNQKLPVPHDALRPSPVNNALASCSRGRMLWSCASTFKGPQRTHHPGEEASPQQMVTVRVMGVRRELYLQPGRAMGGRGMGAAWQGLGGMTKGQSSPKGTGERPVSESCCPPIICPPSVATVLAGWPGWLRAQVPGQNRPGSKS